MSCCSTHTDEDSLEPYQLRARYIRQISRFAQTGIFGQALNVFKEISNNLGVNASTKRLSNLAVSDLLAEDEFLVDRDAYRYLQRLHEALIYRNERQISHICKLLIKHFDFDPTNDIKRDLEKANQETLVKSDLSIICMYGLDLSRKKNLKKVLALLCRCPEVKKIELMFCTLNHENVLKLFEATMKLESLYYLGLRGNSINAKSVFMLHRLLEEPQNFPALMWVDLRNNYGINTIPGQFVQLLMERRKTHHPLTKTADENASISVQDAINGKKQLRSESLYHKDSTTRRPLNKVEPCFAGLVPGWVTKNEYPV